MQGVVLPAISLCLFQECALAPEKEYHTFLPTQVVAGGSLRCEIVSVVNHQILSILIKIAFLALYVP